MRPQAETGYLSIQPVKSAQWCKNNGLGAPRQTRRQELSSERSQLFHGLGNGCRLDGAPRPHQAGEVLHVPDGIGAEVEGAGLLPHGRGVIDRTGVKANQMVEVER